MPIKFDFVSPGVDLREIDQSQIEPVADADGIVLIGRTRQGPAMTPVKVESLEDYYAVFGNPIDGSQNDDPWREGNTSAPSYASYAAQAYLAAGVGPLKMVRLLGQESDSATGTKAGWQINNSPAVATANNVGSYGIFLCKSGSATQDASLAAVMYLTGASLAITGTTAKGVAKQGAGILFQSNDDTDFTLAISGATGVDTLDISFNPTDTNYIRNVITTDATLLEASTNYTNGVDSKYFLGETYDIDNSYLAGNGAGSTYAFVALMESGSTAFGDRQKQMTAAKTGWIVGTKPTEKKLFRLCSLHEGSEFQNNYTVSITNISLPSTRNGSTASFTVNIIQGRDVVETFANCNFDKNSANYISKKIGDYYQTWNDSSRKYTQNGLYPNASAYVRVELASSVVKGDTPLGWLLPKAPAVKTFHSGTAGSTQTWFEASGSTLPDLASKDDQSELISDVPSGYTASVSFPTFRLTEENGSATSANFANTYLFGYDPARKAVAQPRGNGQFGASRPDASHSDYCGINGFYKDPHLAASDANSAASEVFSLMDMKTGSANLWYYENGSYDASTSYAAEYDLASLINTVRVKQMRLPFFGGFDGVDIQKADPFSNTRLATGTETNNYAVYTLNKAIDIVSDKDLIRYDLISMPGVINHSLNTKLVNMVTERGDALAIIDREGIYQPDTDNNGSEQPASITTVISKMKTDIIDSSYGAAYFPNVNVKDTVNPAGTVLIMPPSVAGIGAIAASEKISDQPWFAPAGFNRGGLGTLGGVGGPNVTNTVEHLTKDDRDDLYEVSLNPIARFPATQDYVIFGQKTLQTQMSALDRINVRRLMIYLKKQIGDIADTILFDSNIQSTWNRFKSKAEVVLANAKSEGGISEYKLVLDDTTTTPDLIDQNILYAQVYIKPARAIEFIAIDFVITKTGVEF